MSLSPEVVSPPKDETVVFIPSHLTRGLVSGSLAIVAGSVAIVTAGYAVKELSKVTLEEVYALVRPGKLA